MGYTVVKSFERGLDTRRMIDTTEVGGLLDAKDCHVTRGGEIEKRAAFVVKGTFPAGTVGFYAQPGDVFNTWGTDPAAPAGMPVGGVYHPIPHPDGLVLEHILQVEEFQTKLYVVAQYAGGKLAHWWDDNLITTYIPPPQTEPPTEPGVPGDEIPPPDTGQTGASPKTNWHLYIKPPPSNATNPADPGWKFHALQYAWLHKPGVTKYKWSGSTQNSYSLIATDHTDVNGAPFTNAHSWPNTTDSAIALHISDVINQNGVPALGVTAHASASGTQLSLWMDETSSRFNGWSVTIGGWFDAFPDWKVQLSGGLDRATSGLLSWTLNVDLQAGEEDQPLLLGTFAIAHELKMYTVNGSRLNISMLKNAMRWDDNADAIGSGFIEMDMVTGGTPVLIAMADYEDTLVVFGLRHILIWHMDEDPDKNIKQQVLHRTGLVAPHAQVAYGAGEVLYLDRSGIRSLRTRTGVDQAFAADIGTLIDSLVREKIVATAFTERFLHFWADVEPRSGRMWMALEDVIYVLSYYPDSHISAWTYYDASAHPVDYMNATDETLYWRSGDDIISYSGDTGAVYDATEAVVRVPYVDGSKPATHKNWVALDLAAYGSWQIKASFDPTVPTALDLIANITKSTYAQQKIAMNGESPAVSLELRSSFVGPARIGNAAVHYTDSTAD